MAENKIVKIWLVEYCCKHKYHAGMRCVRLLTGSDFLLQSSISKVRLSLMALHDIVVKTFDIGRFPTAISLANDVFDALPLQSLSYKLFAKVTTGLKILTLFHMLGNGDKMVLPRLNEFFPRTGVKHRKAEKKLAENLSSLQSRFRKFFLELSANKEEQRKYMEKGYKEEYGPYFKNKIKDLLSQFIDIVEKELPPTHIEKFQLEASNVDSKLGDKLSCVASPSINLMFDMLCDQKKLSEDDIKKLVQAFQSEEEQITVNSQFQKKLPESRVHQTETIKSADTVAEKGTKRKFIETTILEENTTEECNLARQTVVVANHCTVEDSSMGAHMYDTLNNTSSYKVPMGKIYKMNPKAYKINNNNTMSANCEKNYSILDRVQKVNSDNQLLVPIPEQVQTVSSSSEAESQGHSSGKSSQQQESNPADTQNEKNNNSQIEKTVSMQSENVPTNLYPANTNSAVQNTAKTNSHTINTCISSSTPPRGKKSDLTLSSSAAEEYVGHQLHNESGEGDTSFDGYSLYQSCVSTPQYVRGEALTRGTDEEQAQAVEAASRVILTESGRHSSLSMVSDSDHSSLNSPTILSSSYSMDKYEALCDSEHLPELCRHLKHQQTRLCVVKLYRGAQQHFDSEGYVYDVYI